MSKNFANRVASNVERMFGQPTYIHEQDSTTGDMVIKTTSGKIVSRTPTSINPLSGDPFKFLHSYAAKCIKGNSNDPDYPVINEPIVVDFKGGSFYMYSPNGGVCNSSAQLGVDFELLNIPGNDKGLSPGHKTWRMDQTFQQICNTYYKV